MTDGMTDKQMLLILNMVLEIIEGSKDKAEIEEKIKRLIAVSTK